VRIEFDVPDAVIDALADRIGARLQQTPSNQLVTAPQLARQLNMRVHRVYDLARAQQIPSVKIGRNLRFNPAAVNESLVAGVAACFPSRKVVRRRTVAARTS
jgi:excisionase family DNA binding protein